MAVIFLLDLAIFRNSLDRLQGSFINRRKHHLHRKALVTTLRAKKAKAFWSLGRTSNAFLTKMMLCAVNEL